MTTVFKWLDNRYLIGWSLAFWATVDLVLVGIECDLSKSDWGTWVGSVGTVGTLIGTIYIAQTGSRERQRSELVKARLYGAGMTMKILIARAKVADMARLLSAAERQEISRVVLIQCLEIHGSIETWEIDEVVAVAPLPNGTAVILAETRDQIRTAGSMLRAYIDEYERSNGLQRRDNAVGVLHLLQGAVRFLDEAMSECRSGALALYHGEG